MKNVEIIGCNVISNNVGNNYRNRNDNDFGCGNRNVGQSGHSNFYRSHYKIIRNAEIIIIVYLS